MLSGQNEFWPYQKLEWRRSQREWKTILHSYLECGSRPLPQTNIRDPGIRCMDVELNKKVAALAEPRKNRSLENDLTTKTRTRPRTVGANDHDSARPLLWLPAAGMRSAPSGVREAK